MVLNPLKIQYCSGAVLRIFECLTYLVDHRETIKSVRLASLNILVAENLIHARKIALIFCG
jgi:hypothetical protein